LVITRAVNDVSHNVASWILAHAEATPDREAVVDAAGRLTYGQLEARCARVAGALLEQGIGAGDRVAFLLGNRSATLELVFAAARIGAIALPINTRLAPPEIAQQLDDGRPRLLFHEAELAETVARAIGLSSGTAETVQVGGDRDAYEALLSSARPHDEILAVTPDDPMLLMYTSGTTGVPKGALLPHRKTRTNSLNAQRFFGTEAEDRVLTVVPLFHSFGLGILAIPALFCGACVVLQPRFDAGEMWHAVEREGITYLGGVPTMFGGLLDALDAGRPDTRTLRFLFTAGAAIPVDFIHAFETRGLRLLQGFGQTETSILCCLGAEDAVRKAGSVGKPVHHAEVRVARVDSLKREPAQWEICDAGETGEIVVRGDLTMLGYWDRPDATAETLREGWLRTGDLATRDEEGFITLTGRARDMIISGGENVYPRQVEAVYETHPDIDEMAVVGVADERWGETGRAFVVLNSGATLDALALQLWGREQLAAFKVPSSFVAVTELPKTVTGKVQKFRLLQADAARSTDARRR
jgi:fatty-acyl-CoA synthase